MSEQKNNQQNEAKNDENKKEENKDRRFLLNKDVNAQNIEKIVMEIHKINDFDAEQEEKDSNYMRKPIKLIVDSFGGSIYCGLLLLNTIENSDTPVFTYCYSKAMSMGLKIFIVGHKRFASPMAILMYHDAGTTQGDTVEGIQQNIDQLKRIIKRIDAMIVNYSDGKVTQKQLDKIKREKKNWYIFGDEAFKLGLVDELLESKRNKHRMAINKSN